MSYLVPCSAPISDNYQAHKNRNSAEPGTDYACAYGTDVVAGASGVVAVVVTGNGGAAGRRVTIDLDDGRRLSYIHLSQTYVKAGQRVSAGQVIAKSGASGFGQDWHYGPHVHVSLWERPGMNWADTINFELYVGASDNVVIEIGVDEMIYINVKGKAGSRRGGAYMVLKDNKGQLFARFCSTTPLAGVPTLSGDDEISDFNAVLLKGSQLK